MLFASNVGKQFYFFLMEGVRCQLSQLIGSLKYRYWITLSVAAYNILKQVEI